MAGGKKKKQQRGNKSRKNGSSGGKKPAPSLEDVLTQAESAMEMLDIDMAMQLFGYAAQVLRSRMHGTDAGNGNEQDKCTLANVLGKMGELKASCGDVEGARNEFLDAIELLGNQQETAEVMQGDVGECNIATAQNSESKAGLYLYLGQLSTGTEALTALRIGVSELQRTVSILDRLLASKDDEANGMDIDGELNSLNLKRFMVETKRQLCAAYCSIGELYLTDLCEEPDAENSCEAALKAAVEIDASAQTESRPFESEIGPSQPDALQTMANLRLSQSRVAEALDCIMQTYIRMKVGCEAMSGLVGLATEDKEGVQEAKARELLEVDAASTLPEYGFRLQTAKIMLECTSLVDDGKNSIKEKCSESAIQVLGSLLAENDEVIEVWYLLGCAFMSCSPPNPDSARHYWENAIAMLTKAKEQMEHSGEDVTCELEVVQSQLEEVTKKLDEIGEAMETK
mmetsp:Transcript_3145/g.5174  ORF Transcript_3145/g.5174 Transcript_3145/m.5174 type:complete len:457 (+) Transcript_3145:107-1477(+)